MRRHLVPYVLLAAVGCDDAQEAHETPEEMMESSTGEEPSEAELLCQEPVADNVSGTITFKEDGTEVPVSSLHWGEVHRLESGVLEIALSSRAYEPCKALFAEDSEVGIRAFGVAIRLDEELPEDPHVAYWTSIYAGRHTNTDAVSSVHGSWSSGSEGHAEVSIDCPFELGNLDDLVVGSQVSGHIEFWYREPQDWAPFNYDIEVDADFSLTYCGEQLPWDG